MIGEFVMRPLRKQNNLYPNIGKGMPYRHQTMVVRRTVYDQVGWFNLSYVTSDYDWVCRWESSLINSERSAYYMKGNPVVKMDGGGVSATQESKVIWEAIQIIKRNYSNNIKVYLTLLKRLILFGGRELLKYLGQENYLSKLKHRKYNNKWSEK